MENRKQKRWHFLSPMKKPGIVILVLCLLTLSIAFAATAHYIGNKLSLTPSANSTETSVNSGSQQSKSIQIDGKSQGSTATATASSADITVDFGSRQNRAYPIPSTFLGVGGIGMRAALNNDGNSVLQANIHMTKLGDYDYMSQVFPTPASATNASLQYWTNFDQEMALAISYHLQPIITIANTPSWLQPQNQNPP